MQAVIKIIIVISNIFSNVLTPNMKYKITRPYNLMCKDEQFLKVNQNWV